MSTSAATQQDSTASSGPSDDWATVWSSLLSHEQSQQPDGRFNWSQISRLLSALRSKFASYAWSSVTKPQCRAYNSTTSGGSRARFYYLAANDSLGQTLWCVDVALTADDAASSEPLPAPGGGDSVQQRQQQGQQQGHYHVKLVSLADLKVQLSAGPVGRAGGLSREEQLLQERKRSFSTGITDYDLDTASGTIAFAYQGFVCHFVDAPDEGAAVITGAATPHMPVHLAICPANPRVAAYAADRSVYCICLASGDVLAAYSLPENSTEAGLSAGLPPFAVQEEFDRFTGFWWRPGTTEGGSSASSALELIVEVVDESAVDRVHIVDPLKAGTTEPDAFAYPRAGTANATSRLVAVPVVVSETGGFCPTNCCRGTAPLPGELGATEPDESREYLVRVDWSPQGEALLGQVMNRAQDRLRLLAYLPKIGATVCLLTETAPEGYWVEVHDLLAILTVGPGHCEFLWASERSGFRHLYYVTATWQQPSNQPPGAATTTQITADTSLRQLTTGEWQIQPDHLAIDEAAGLAYFNATALDVRAHQLCRVAYRLPATSAGGSGQGLAAPSSVEVLTRAESAPTSPSAPPKTCTGTVFPGHGLALTRAHCPGHSSLVRLCQINNNNDNSSSSSSSSSAQLLSPLADLTRPIASNGFFVEPEYFDFTGPGGEQLHGMLFRPFNYQPGRQYPTLQYVYGGPHVQLVTSSFVGFSFHRVTKACYFGFAVLMIDNRGSDNRGRQFAATVRHRLGSPELPDQVAGLQHAARQFGCIDLNRVGLFGWSYGGYLSLLGMRDYNSVYRLGIAGAPVTEWELYDTAYTERYMGLPVQAAGQQRYRAASVIGSSEAVAGFPEEANRLLVVHGCIDENVHFYHTAKLLDVLAAAKKPYNLLIYPSERHGLRNASSKEHFEICLMHFLCQNL